MARLAGQRHGTLRHRVRCNVGTGCAVLQQRSPEAAADAQPLGARHCARSWRRSRCLLCPPPPLLRGPSPGAMVLRTIELLLLWHISSRHFTAYCLSQVTGLLALRSARSWRWRSFSKHEQRQTRHTNWGLAEHRAVSQRLSVILACRELAARHGRAELCSPQNRVTAYAVTRACVSGTHGTAATQFFRQEACCTTASCTSRHL